MSVAAIAADIERRALTLPRVATRFRRVRLCRYKGIFCAWCPDVEDVPCVIAEVMQDCDTCAEKDCPCMTGWTVGRREAVRAWKKKRDPTPATKKTGRR